MNPELYAQADALFAHLLELADEERRPAFEAACGDNDALREAVAQLLRADARSACFLDVPAAPRLAALEDGTGGLFGPYRPIELLGEGGMGRVYLARRDDDLYQRKVAIKVLSGPWQSPAALERFRAERRILARLEHPAIARLYDAGETAEGVPYLVLEHVDGLPIHRHCERYRLGVRARLKLFLRLLEAVAHAHGNLLVHRDLKPENVLVTGEGELKLIDFGIAKDLGEEGAAATRTGLRPLTLCYASPEQLAGRPTSTGSDVYSLGVVLYELLRGLSPYALHLEAPDRLLLAVLSGEVAAPSQLRAPGGAEPELPYRPARELAGDLDAIVLKALALKPERRYGSVSELAQDLRGYLQGLPVGARPVRLGYRLGKWLQRHRKGAVAAAAAAAMLVALGINLVLERRHALTEEENARQTLSFFLETFRGADPRQAGQELTVRQLLEARRDSLRRNPPADPRLRASLFDALGEAAVGLGELELAAPWLEEAHALRQADPTATLEERATSLMHVGWLYFLRSDLPAAGRLLEQAVALWRRASPERPVQLAAALNLLGLARSEGLKLAKAGETAEIERLHEEALLLAERAGGPLAEEAIRATTYLARAHEIRGDTAVAEELYRTALARYRAREGDDNSHAAVTRLSLGTLLLNRGDLDRAEAELRAALAVLERVLPPGHHELAAARHELGRVLARRGLDAEAEPLLRQALAADLKAFGVRNLDTAAAMTNLGVTLEHLGKLDEAEDLQRQALESRLALLGPGHPLVGFCYGRLALLASGRGRHSEAVGLAEEALAVTRRALGAESTEAAYALRSLGKVLLAAGMPERAELELRASLALQAKTGSREDVYQARTESDLGAALNAQGRFEEAAVELGRALEVLSRLPAGNPQRAEAEAELARARRRSRAGAQAGPGSARRRGESYRAAAPAARSSGSGSASAPSSPR